MKSKNTIPKGFTLIELLVVISVIGLLSSVIIASLSPVRDRARVSAARTFSNHNYHAFGADAFGYWKFDEVTGSASVSDISGNGYNLSPSAGTITTDSNVPNTTGRSFPIGGGSVTVKKTGLSGKIGPNLTISGWVYFNSLVDDGWGVSVIRLINSQSTISFSNLYGLGFMVSSPVVRLDAFYDNSSSNYSQTVYDTNIVIGKWYHVAVTFKSVSTINDNTDVTLFIDGKQVAKATNVQIPNTQKNVGIITMGNRTGDAPVSNTGLIVDDLAVYSTSLLSSEIRDIYAQGLSTHKLVSNK
jgi:prepilin-type N-terminal cleavage/methylation domain-containing protein